MFWRKKETKQEFPPVEEFKPVSFADLQRDIQNARRGKFEDTQVDAHNPFASPLLKLGMARKSLRTDISGEEAWGLLEAADKLSGYMTGAIQVPDDSTVFLEAVEAANRGNTNEVLAWVFEHPQELDGHAQTLLCSAAFHEAERFNQAGATIAAGIALHEVERALLQGVENYRELREKLSDFVGPVFPATNINLSEACNLVARESGTVTLGVERKVRELTGIAGAKNLPADKAEEYFEIGLTMNNASLGMAI